MLSPNLAVDGLPLTLQSARLHHQYLNVHSVSHYDEATGQHIDMSLARWLRKHVAKASVVTLAAELGCNEQSLASWEIGEYTCKHACLSDYLKWLDACLAIAVRPDEPELLTK